jgi:hypothetical protein
VRVEAKDPQELWRRSFAVFASGNAAGDGAIPPRDVPTPAKPASSQSVDQGRFALGPGSSTGACLVASLHVQFAGAILVQRFFLFGILPKFPHKL